LRILKTYANSTEELSTSLLKHAHVTGIHLDGQIVYDVKCTVAGMLRRGMPHRPVVEGTSALYGILEGSVEEIVAAVPAETSIPGLARSAAIVRDK